MSSLPSRAFRSWRAPATLNVLAVGASMATVTGAVFHHMWAETYANATFSTFVLGTIWAAAVRVKAKRGGVPLGWILSPVFACANSMLAVALMVTGDPTFSKLVDAIGIIILGGAIFGAIIWIPALLLTLLLFGLPIARAQSIAARGLAGVDRGEIVVGVTAAVLALVGVLISHTALEIGFASVAIASGLVATALSTLRERARRAFVKDVEAGAVAQFRVEPTPLGKVLVRVTTTGIAYRVSDFVEEIATLDERGEVTTSRSAL